MSIFKQAQRLRERLVTNAIEKCLLEIASEPFCDPCVPTSIREVSEKTGIEQEEIIIVFSDYRVYGMEMLKSDGKCFLRLKN